MLVLAKGQRNLLRVAGGVGDVVLGVDGLSVGGAVDAALTVGVGAGALLENGSADEVRPSVELPAVGLGVTAVCACA